MSLLTYLIETGSLYLQSTHHAFLTLDHKPLVFVHATDTTDNVVVFVVAAPSFMVVMVGVVSLQRIRAVGFAGRLTHNLVDLYGGFMTRTVVSFP